MNFSMELIFSEKKMLLQTKYLTLFYYLQNFSYINASVNIFFILGSIRRVPCALYCISDLIFSHGDNFIFNRNE